MAGSYNKVLLMGNLTRDVEVRNLQNDMAVANFGLAVNRKFRTRDGENREEVTFVDCEAWGRTAETMGRYLSKGRPVFVEGRLKLDTWQDKDSGANRSKLKVVIDNFQFIDSRGDGVPSGVGASSSNAGGGSAPPADAGYVPIDEDDIPF